MGGMGQSPTTDGDETRRSSLRRVRSLDQHRPKPLISSLYTLLTFLHLVSLGEIQ